MSSLAEELPAAINRARQVQDQFKKIKTMPGMEKVTVDPQINLLEHEIQEGVAALASGDVVRMLRAYEAVKDYRP